MTESATPERGSAPSFTSVVRLPLAVGILSVALLALENVDRGYLLRDLLLPLLAAVIVALGAAWLSQALATTRDEAALLGAYVVLLLLFGGRIAGALTDLLTSASIGGFLLIAILLAVPTLLVLLRLGRARRWGWRTVRTGEIAAFILIGLAAIQLLPDWVQHKTPNIELAWEHEFDLDSHPPDTRPDIYFIMVDAYSGPTSLREIYGLDIEPTMRALEALGFQVPVHARANYIHTFLALATALNWQYLQDDPAVLAAVDMDLGRRRELYPFLHHNRTTEFLRSQGYRTVFLSSAYAPLRSSPVADVVVPDGSVSPFMAGWMDQSVLGLLTDAACGWAPCSWASTWLWSVRPDSAAAHRDRFQHLVRAARASETPTFFYVHLLLPHWPFVFDAGCEARQPVWPLGPHAATDGDVHEAYADQVICLNSLMLTALESIIREGRGDPVIILQSDHGYGRWVQMIPLEDVPTSRVRERLDIFAAYQVPDGIDLVLPDGVTPINAMREVFSSVFGIPLPVLEDRSYWSTWGAPFDFTPVSPEVSMDSANHHD